ncbi:acetylxylan esterase [Coraliomargarita algicola]|uniref:Acetylxylan esterase n=1 Tax=Coraliomargarita algicola TaxID=3092156 RepID=A0ABZ0RNS0_9BACT|nr:acetylxylan esterase [Coraliomargarita sp. J2-16]WPJ96879.1 acetylxylan esterase [Coraliomargarita sp. J2-16]
MTLRIQLTFFFWLFAVKALAQTYTFDVQQSHADGVYQVGESIRFTARILEQGEVARDKAMRAMLYHNGREVSRKLFALGEFVSMETSLDAPGWCQFAVEGVDAEGNRLEHEVRGTVKAARAYMGALVDPLAVQAGAPEPADFDAFWAKEKEKLQAIPMEVKRTPVTEDIPEHFKVEYVEVPVGSGYRPVNGIVRKPVDAAAKSLPIHLFVHGAGVHGPLNPAWAPWLPQEAGLKRPVLFMNLNAHGIPTDQPKEYYQALAAGELDGYQYQHSDDPEKYYMKGMILRLIRALEYLKAQPEWNGRDIVVGGTSQGGAQALIAGGIDPDVTFVHADVPAMCDYGGTFVGRASGWPKLYELKNDGKIWLKTSRDYKENKLVSEEEVQHLGYFDAANFAHRMRAQAVLYTGGVDGTCPPSSVFAAYNSIPHENKSILFDPIAGHGRRRYEEGEVAHTALFLGSEKVSSDSQTLE